MEVRKANSPNISGVRKATSPNLTVGTVRPVTLNMGTNTGMQYAAAPNRTYNPQARTYNPQAAGYNPQQTGWGNLAGGGGGGENGNVQGAQYDPAVIAAAAEAAKKAEEDAKRGKLRGEGSSYIDQLMAIYDEIMNKIKTTGADSTSRINKSYDGKVAEQTDLMNEGMYQTDASNAANNLANSSWMSFDRTKVRKAKEANESVLNEKRGEDLGVIGKMVSEDTARWNADKEGLGRTRTMLGETEDINELTSTVNTLDATTRNSNAAKAKYGTQGEFVAKANSLGNYDTSELEKSLGSIVANASASPENKAAAMDDLLNGTPLDEGKKKELKNKYSQVV